LAILGGLLRHRWLAGLSAVGVVALLFLAQAGHALACDISINAPDLEPAVGQQEEVTVTVIQTHKNCITPIEDTLIEVEGLTIVSEGEWEDIDGGHEKTLTVSFAQVGEASLTVIRECSKGGDTAVATFNVGLGTEAAGTAGGTASSEAAPVKPSGGDSVSNKAMSASPTGKTSSFSSQVIETLREPKTIAMAVLLFVAAIGHVRGYQRLRRIVMLASLGFLGFYVGGCLCPLGAVQKLALSSSGVKAAFLITLGLPLLATLLMGRIYCGWVCPAGALQEIVHSDKNGIAVPAGLHRWLKYLKYVLFVALIALVRYAGEPVFEQWDPFRVAWEFDGAIIPVFALMAIIVASVFIYRPWCRYLCPMGALFALASRFSLSKTVTESSCVGCKLCSRSCSAQSLTVDEKSRTATIDQAECMTCGLCRSSCRKAGLSLKWRFSGGSIRNRAGRVQRRPLAEGIVPVTEEAE
jgi:NosR/NirI family nitrous oxide reductase transcriptional regulator